MIVKYDRMQITHLLPDMTAVSLPMGRFLPLRVFKIISMTCLMIQWTSRTAAHSWGCNSDSPDGAATIHHESDTTTVYNPAEPPFPRTDHSSFTRGSWLREPSSQRRHEGWRVRHHSMNDSPYASRSTAGGESFFLLLIHAWTSPGRDTVGSFCIMNIVSGWTKNAEDSIEHTPVVGLSISNLMNVVTSSCHKDSCDTPQRYETMFVLVNHVGSLLMSSTVTGWRGFSPFSPGSGSLTCGLPHSDAAVTGSPKWALVGVISEAGEPGRKSEVRDGSEAGRGLPRFSKSFNCMPVSSEDSFTSLWEVNESEAVGEAVLEGGKDPAAFVDTDSAPTAVVEGVADCDWLFLLRSSWWPRSDRWTEAEACGALSSISLTVVEDGDTALLKARWENCEDKVGSEKSYFFVFRLAFNPFWPLPTKPYMSSNSWSNSRFLRMFASLFNS